MRRSVPSRWESRLAYGAAAWAAVALVIGAAVLVRGDAPPYDRWRYVLLAFLAVPFALVFFLLAGNPAIEPLVARTIELLATAQLQYTDPAGVQVTQIGVTALLALALCGWAEPLKLVWSWSLVSGVVITGLLATALAFTVQTWAQRHTTPARAALIFALEPVSAALTAFLAVGEVLAGKALLGAALILAGVLIVELKPVGPSRHLLE